MYKGIIDCLTKGQLENPSSISAVNSRRIKLLFNGYSAAALAQVPYAVIAISSFDALNNSVFSYDEETIYDKQDEIPLSAKYVMRFGAMTLSLLLAQTVLYPLDTIKRCMQLDGSLGHRKLYRGGLISCAQTLVKD